MGDGWLIFGLPPSEIAVHPSGENDLHEMYLMCDDIKLFISKMSKHNIVCSEIKNQGWGLLTQLTLPGGGKLGVYQPRHARPEAMNVKPASKKKVTAGTKKSIRKKLPDKKKRK